MIRSAKVSVLVLGALILMEGAAGCADYKAAMATPTGSHRSPRGGCRVVAGGALDPTFNFFNESVEGVGTVDYRPVGDRLGETVIITPAGDVQVVGWSNAEDAEVWNERRCVPTGKQVGAKRDMTNVACEDFDGNGTVECVDGVTGKQVAR